MKNACKHNLGNQASWDLSYWTIEFLFNGVTFLPEERVTMEKTLAEARRNERPEKGTVTASYTYNYNGNPDASSTMIINDSEELTYIEHCDAEMCLYSAEDDLMEVWRFKNCKFTNISWTDIHLDVSFVYDSCSVDFAPKSLFDVSDILDELDITVA